MKASLKAFENELEELRRQIEELQEFSGLNRHKENKLRERELAQERKERREYEKERQRERELAQERLKKITICSACLRRYFKHFSNSPMRDEYRASLMAGWPLDIINAALADMGREPWGVEK